MQVIGLCRFSYPAIGGFQIEHDTIEEREQFLYQPARMEERFRLFETIALPGLRAQTDQDFDLIVMIGDSLPKPYRDRLHDITADLPQVAILSEPPQRQRDVMKEALQNARMDPARPCLQFRHDDDDAVSVDFVQRLRQTTSDCLPFLQRHPTVALDFNRGYSASFDAEGIKATETFRPYLGIGFAMYSRGGCKQTIMNFAHHKIHRFMPSITMTDAPIWVRSLNQFNDSKAGRSKSDDLALLSPEQEVEFKARFAIDANQIRQVFRGA